MNFYDCKGGPGTTEPACGACVTCLHRVIESKDAEVTALRERIKRLEEESESRWKLAEAAVSSCSDMDKRIKRLEEAGAWIPSSTKPEGFERRVMLWVDYNGFGWRDRPEAKIGWWKHGPGCFAFDEFENADHLVTHWMEIQDPAEAKEAKP